MKRTRMLAALTLILTMASLQMACSSNLFSGGTAKQNAIQALVTTTRSCVLMMTAAGIAYDAGAFGPPGSERAENTWSKIAAESIRMNSALNDWQAAVKANKDASSFQALVSQALAVVGALLPAGKRVELDTMTPLIFTDADVRESIRRLGNPPDFRARFVLGGAQ